MQAEYNGQTPYFDKETTLIIKGIAVVLMFAHHFFTFPYWWVEGINYPFLEKYALLFSAPLRLCVPVFCFLSGYFYFYNKEKNYSYSFRKITDVLIDYWGVFFLFAIIAVMTVHYVYTPVNFIKEMFALYRPTMYFCWYVCFYYLFMLILPWFSKLLSKNIHFDLLVSIVLFPAALTLINHIVFSIIENEIINEAISNLITWVPVVLLGYIFASYNLFDRMMFYFKIIPSKIITVILWLIGAICAPVGRIALPSFSLNFPASLITHKAVSFTISMDVFYTPIFIFCVINLCRTIKLKYVQYILKQIGKYSLLMWFISCIFFSNSKTVFQPILYWPHNPGLVLAWGLLLCYFASVIIDLGLSAIIKQKNRIIFHRV